MSFHKRQPLEELYEQKKLIIKSSIPELPFSPEKQIGENSIDLRLHPQVKKLKKDIGEIDLLKIDRLDDSYFDEEILTDKGYILEPKEMLFCQTLEVINVISPHHIGIVVGRTKIAAYGVSVNFDQVKAPAGLLWNFPLHIQNNTDKPMVIYPFIFVAQLMIFPYAYGKCYKQDGDYHRIDFLNHLGINQKERDTIRETLNDWKPKQSNYQFQVNQKKVVKEIEEMEKKETPFLKLWRTIINFDFLYDFLTAGVCLTVPASVLYQQFHVPLPIIIGLTVVISVLHASRKRKNSLL